MLKGFAWALALLLSTTAMAQDGPRILLLTKSAGYQHDVVKNDKDGNNHVSTIMKKLAADNGASIVVTKDARLINKLTLQRFDLVIFYTTLDLTSTNGDGSPGMTETGIAELAEWIEAGGGFMGYHCATDTFHEKDGQVTPYTKLIGGEFASHGHQFNGSIKVVDPSHPAMAATPKSWSVHDEYYIFKNLNKENMHILAMLEIGDERKNKDNPRYDIPDYPIIWCSTVGKGRVYYSVQGHPKEVWNNPDFQKTVLAAAHWVTGNGTTQAEPNYAKILKESK